MAVNDSVSDLITTIRNGQGARMAYVQVPASNLRKGVLAVLTEEGYIRGYTDEKSARGLPEFKVELKYYEGQPVIQKIEKISKPGRRVYSQVGKLPRYYNGLGITILSTSKGVLSDTQARQQQVGGEILCRVF